MPQPGGRAGPGPLGRTTQLKQVKTYGLRGDSAPALGAQGPLREALRDPFQLAGPLTRPLLPGPGAVMLEAPRTGGSGQRERPAALPGHLGPLRDPPSLAITPAERADPATALCWPLRARRPGGAGGRSAFRPFPGGRGRATTRPAGTAGANASGKDRAAASPRGQVRGRKGSLVGWWRSLFPDIWDESPLFSPGIPRTSSTYCGPPALWKLTSITHPSEAPLKSLMNPQGDD